MTVFIQTLLQISISMAAVIGLFLLLVPVWQKRYSARWRKVIWLVIAIRLFVPFSIELPSAPVQVDMNLEERTKLTIPVRELVYPETHYDMAVAPEITPGITNQTDTISAVPMIVQQQESVSYGMILFGIWIVGVIAFGLWHSVQYMMFCRKVNESAQPLEEGEALLQQAGAELNLNRYPSVAVSHRIQGPMLIGFRKPVILLPGRIYGEQELLLILRHELMHYKHYDLWYKLVLLLANAVHWFNPLVWMMNRQAGRDLELACDNYVVTGQDLNYRKAYSMTLLNTMARQKSVALSTYLSKNAQNAKKRLAGILQPKQYKKGVIEFCSVILLTVLASGCLQFTQPVEGATIGEAVFFWNYSGYLDAFPWENAENSSRFSSDYDGDGKKDRVYRSEAQVEGYYNYQIEFANGKVLKIEESVADVGYPQIDGADLTGDGQNEIIFQVSYPTSTNPLGVGELIVLEKNDGIYQPMELPFETGDEVYQRKLPVTYNKADGQAVEVSVAGTDFKQVIPIDDDLWNGYLYKDYFANGETMESTVWAYKIQQQDSRYQMICSIQLFDKWADDGLDIALTYKNGALVIDKIQFCEDIYTEWM